MGAAVGLDVGRAVGEEVGGAVGAGVGANVGGTSCMKGASCEKDAWSKEAWPFASSVLRDCARAPLRRIDTAAVNT